MQRFIWWLEHVEGVSPTLSDLTPDRVRRFLAYAQEANPEGRFGSSRASARREARPATVNAYYRILRAFFHFCQDEGLLTELPLQNVRCPRVPRDEIQPLTSQQLQQLVDAARRSSAPERDSALILLLADTGLRISELLNLRIGDFDLGDQKLTVVGKGNKRRQTFFGRNTRRALWRYLEADRAGADATESLFTGHAGPHRGRPLSHTGAHLIVQRAGKAAGLHDVVVNPHNLRRTFAINFLRNGGSVLELQRLLGHEDLSVIQRYAVLAEADLADSHRRASPADRLDIR